MKDKQSQFPKYDNSEVADNPDYEESYNNDEQLEESTRNNESLDNDRLGEESLEGESLVNSDENAVFDSESDDLTDEEVTEIEKEETLTRDKKRRGTIRIVAGGYLLYLCYESIIEPLIKGTFDTPIHFAIIFAIFGILGLVFIINGIKSIR